LGRLFTGVGKTKIRYDYENGKKVTQVFKRIRRKESVMECYRRGEKREGGVREKGGAETITPLERHSRGKKGRKQGTAGKGLRVPQYGERAIIQRQLGGGD